ncbi:MAG: cell division FtsX domain-containing protein [Leptospirales bacterium]
MIVVLHEHTDARSLQSVMGKIVQVSGDNSVHVLDPKDMISRISYLPVSTDFKNIWKNTKILSVDISFGKDGKGDPTYLVPQIESIHSLLQNDPTILFVQGNEPWASRLDTLERLFIRIRSVGIILFSLSLFSILFLWGYAIRAVSITNDSESINLSTRKSFWMEPSDENAPLTEIKKSTPRTGLVIGLLSGTLSMILVWASHAALYPHWADPFLIGASGKGESWRLLWMGIPVLTGVIGWFSGILSRILPS